MSDDASRPAMLSPTQPAVGGPSSLRHRWTRRFALVLVLSLISGAMSLYVVVNLTSALRSTAAEVDDESLVMIGLRDAINREDGFAHQLVDQGAVVASDFLSTDQAVTGLLRSARVAYTSDSERALVDQVEATWNDAYAVFRPVASDPALADRFGPELPDKDGFHRSLLAKRAAIDAPLAALDSVSREEIHDEIRDANSAKHRLVAMLALLFVVLGGLTFLLSRRLSREVLQPIDQLSESARRFAAGRLDHRLEVTGTDEFSKLATQFNAMAAAIATSHQHLTTQAHYDHLTGLLNRARFLERLRSTFEHARGGPVWIGFLDLDDFKVVNDTCGHDAGDELLRQVANRLLAATRPLDVVARLGGDEFAIIFGADADDHTVELVAQRLIDAVAEPMFIFGQDQHIGASIGLARRDDPDITVDQLIRRADIAMYTAKGRGKNRWERYDPEVHGGLTERRLADLSGDPT